VTETRRRAFPQTAMLLCVASLVVGCLHLPEQAPPPRRWVLAAPGDTAPADTFTATLGVGPVELPAYLDRSEIVERLSENELRDNAFEVWGEPLAAGFQRVLATEVAKRVPGLAVVGFPWKGPADLDYRLTVVVTRFEHDVPGDAVVLETGWALRDVRQGGGPIASRVETLREPVQGSEFDAVITAMSRAVAGLAERVATALEQAQGPHGAGS